MKIKRQTKSLKQLCTYLGVKEIQAFTFQTYSSEADIHTRNICPREGVEDPACGVGNSAVGSYLLKNYYIDKSKIIIKSEQGHVVNMPSMVNIYAYRKNQEIEVYVGGSGKVMIKGEFIL